MDPERSGGRTASEALAGLRATEPPRLVFLRRAPAGLGDGAGVLLCLSASFNPLTVAHTALIREASRLMPPREILLLLAMANVDKPVTGLPLEARLDLLVRYAESRPSLSVAAVAHGRFVDKLEAIRAAYPAETRVIFLLGFDTLVRLFDPKYYPDRTAALSRLFGGSECIVANRAPAPPSDVDAFLARDEVSPFVQRIHSIQLPADLAEVSATAVRARLALGRPVADLVPPEIRTALTRERSHEPLT
jgi:nicotinamide-nucleotide adenylyltransferase